MAATRSVTLIFSVIIFGWLSSNALAQFCPEDDLPTQPGPEEIQPAPEFGTWTVSTKWVDTVMGIATVTYTHSNTEAAPPPPPIVLEGENPAPTPTPPTIVSQGSGRADVSYACAQVEGAWKWVISYFTESYELELLSEKFTQKGSFQGTPGTVTGSKTTTQSIVGPHPEDDTVLVDSRTAFVQEWTGGTHRSLEESFTLSDSTDAAGARAVEAHFTARRYRGALLVLEEYTMDHEMQFDPTGIQMTYEKEVQQSKARAGGDFSPLRIEERRESERAWNDGGNLDWSTFEFKRRNSAGVLEIALARTTDYDYDAKTVEVDLSGALVQGFVIGFDLVTGSTSTPEKLPQYRDMKQDEECYRIAAPGVYTTQPARLPGPEIANTALSSVLPEEYPFSTGAEVPAGGVQISPPPILMMMAPPGPSSATTSTVFTPYPSSSTMMPAPIYPTAP